MIKTNIRICISLSWTAARRWKTLLSFIMLIKWNYLSRAAEKRGNPVQWGSNWSPLIRLPLHGDSCLRRGIGVEVGIYFSSFLCAWTCLWIELGAGSSVKSFGLSGRADFTGFCWYFDGNLSSLTKVSCQISGLNWTFCHLIVLYFLSS